MHHHVFRMHRKQHVRKYRVVKHARSALVLLLVIVLVLDLLFFPSPSITSRSTITSTKGIYDSQRTGVPAHGQTLALIDLHEPAKERSFAQIVLGRIVR